MVDFDPKLAHALTALPEKSIYYTGCYISGFDYTPDKTCPGEIAENTSFYVYAIENYSTHDCPLNSLCVFGGKGMDLNIRMDHGGARINSSELIVPLTDILEQKYQQVTRVYLIVRGNFPKEITLGSMRICIQYCYRRKGYDKLSGSDLLENSIDKHDFGSFTFDMMLRYVRMRNKSLARTSGVVQHINLEGCKFVLNFVQQHYFLASSIARMKAIRKGGDREYAVNHPEGGGTIWYG